MYKFLNEEELNNMSSNEILELLEFNKEENLKIKKEISTLNLQDNFKKETETNKETKLVSIPKKEIDEDFEDEIEYYLDNINQLKEDNLEFHIKKNLPNHKNTNYKKILQRLILELKKNIKDINEIILTENLNKEELTDFKKEILFEKKKIDLIYNYMEEKQEDNEISQRNKLFFVTTSSNNIRVIEELKKIDSTYYQDFLSLYNSIIDSTFKSVKRFTNNNELNGICEVRCNQTRVLFARLDENTYAVICNIIKKVDNDYGYRNTISQRIKRYREIKDKLINNLNNEDFIKEQENIEKQVFNILNADNKNKENTIC